MRKLLVLLVALVTVAAFAAVNFSGSFSVTPTLTYQASPSSITFDVPVSGSFSIRGTNSDETTGLSVSIGLGRDSFNNPIWTFKGRIWHKLYVTDPLTITLRAGNDTYSSGYVASIFNMKFAPISDELALYIVPDATSVVDFNLSNTFSFEFLTVGLTIEQLLEFDTHKSFELSAELDLARALALTDVTTLSVSFTGGFDLTQSVPLKSWTVEAAFGIGAISGSVSFDDTNKLKVGLSTTVDILTVGTSIDAKVTDLMGTLNVEGYASWTTGVISNRASVKWEAGSQKLTAAWKLSVSF